MIIKTYNQNKDTQPALFVARVGQKAGRPQRELTYNPSNVFGVWLEEGEDRDTLYQRLKLIWDLKLCYPYLRGSCQPLITLGDYKQVINSAPEFEQKELEKLALVEKQLDNLKKTLENYEQMHSLLQRSIYQQARR